MARKIRSPARVVAGRPDNDKIKGQTECCFTIAEPQDAAASSSETVKN